MNDIIKNMFNYKYELGDGSSLLERHINFLCQIKILKITETNALYWFYYLTYRDQKLPDFSEIALNINTTERTVKTYLNKFIQIKLLNDLSKKSALISLSHISHAVHSFERG